MRRTRSWALQYKFVENEHFWCAKEKSGFVKNVHNFEMMFTLGEDLNFEIDPFTLFAKQVAQSAKMFLWEVLTKIGLNGRSSHITLINERRGYVSGRFVLWLGRWGWEWSHIVEPDVYLHKNERIILNKNFGRARIWRTDIIFLKMKSLEMHNVWWLKWYFFL